MMKFRIEFTRLTKTISRLSPGVGVAVAMLALVATPKASAAVKPGWGAPASFLGRYHMIVQGISTRAPETAGIFATAITTANRLLVVAQTPTQGQLTLFMRTVKKTKPPAPSGIFSFVSPAGSDVLYLTNLTTSGTRREALVHGGSFLGPSIGTFEATSWRPGQITATVSAQELGRLGVRFVRFSTNPKP